MGRKTAHNAKSVSGVSCGQADLSQLQSAIYVTMAGPDSDTCGATYDQGCKTVVKGIARCAASGCGVLVGFGEYQLTDPVVLRDGVSVYGGCIPIEGPTDFQSLVNAPGGGRPAITASTIAGGVVLHGFKLAGTQADSAGAASVVMAVSSSGNLKVLNTRILAGGGMGGSVGSSSGKGADGKDGSGAAGGVSANCGTAGGNGSVKRDVSVDVGSFSFSFKPSCSSNSCSGFTGSPASTGATRREELGAATTVPNARRAGAIRETWESRVQMPRAAVREQLTRIRQACFQTARGLPCAAVIDRRAAMAQVAEVVVLEGTKLVHASG